MSEPDFFDTTPMHFMRRRRAWIQNRPALEAARFVSFHTLKAAGYKINRFEQVVKFPWDVTVRRVKLEAWDSPAMLKFSEEADRALAVLNPEAYAAYMAGKAQREREKAVAIGADMMPGMGLEDPTPDPSPEGRGDVTNATI